ncbi:hypothetical protein H0H92_013955 [Tricholoma furcatifolium]|nr:hypothetical protein H0H92_013955 [Tricholoma furcatifolium]
MSNVNPTGRNIRPAASQSEQRFGNNDHLADSQTSWEPDFRSRPNNGTQPPPPSITLVQHDELPPQYAEYSDGTNNPQFDPLASSFSAMHIAQPGLGSQIPDPIPRAGSSLSLRSLQNPQSPPHRHPMHASTLPLPNHANYYPAESSVGDGASMHSAHSRNHEADRNSFPYDDPHSGYTSPESITFPNQTRGFWQPPTSEYNPLYAAASNVLGMGPPPGPSAGPVRQSSPMPGYPQHHPSVASSQSSLSSSQSAPFPGQSSHLNSHASPGYPQNFPAGIDSDPRPSIQRDFVAPSTNKSKAVDLSSPPFTKEYIDQYRQRIKADPDPEAHFLYAKYLIDAARHIRTSAKDQRVGKKYSEILIAESLKVIRRLATQGEAYDEAQFFLANCYGTGSLGLQVDHEKAYHLYLQAAKQNHAAASYRVAVCNEIGAGTRKESPRAAAFYRKAASLGDTAAMYKLGMILLGGLLEQQKNPREAISWLKRAAEQADADNPHALHELALLHEVPNSTLVPYDPAYARSLFTQAAQLGYTPSQFKLGQCYEYGTLSFPVDPRRSIAWYTKAAEKGDSEAELALSGWYLTGSEGVLKQSDSEAYLWARRAANKGLSKAEYAVGYYAEVGIGIKQDIEFAKRWYMRAAAQGNKRAMNRLTEMKRMGNKRANVARPTRQQAKDECVSLLQYLDLSQLNCLNESPDHTLKSILAQKARNNSSNFLESDADAQLLLSLPHQQPILSYQFNQTVKVQSIVLHSSKVDQAPLEVKIAINRPNLGFSDIEDAVEPAVTQVLELTKDDVMAGKPAGLRFVRFQAVNSLHNYKGLDWIEKPRDLNRIPTRLAKPVLPVLYAGYLLTSIIFVPRHLGPGESEKAPKSQVTPRNDVLRTLILSLPTTSQRLRLAIFFINTTLFIAAADFVIAPYLDSASDVVFTRVGAVYPDSVKIVVRYPQLDPSVAPLRLLYRESSNKNATSWKDGPSLNLTPNQDWVDTVRIDSLWPNTSYEYTLSFQNRTILDASKPPLSFRTFPDSRLSTGSRFKFIVSSCMTPNFPYNGPLSHRSIHGFDLLAEYLYPSEVVRSSNSTSNETVRTEDTTGADFMLFLGDFIYADVPIYIGDDKEAYRRLYRRNYNSDSFRKIYQRLPIFHAYDDHEFINNFGASGNDSTPPYINASGAFKLYNSNANFDPIHPGEHYYEFRYGDSAFFVMDTRRYREAMGTSNRTMLGSTQLTSLYEWLSRVNATATFKFVVTSVPFTSLWGHDAQTDSWAGFPEEKQALLSAFHTVPNVILLSGDRHEFAAIEFTSPDPKDYSVLEISTSPLSMFYIPFVRTLEAQSPGFAQRNRTKVIFSESNSEPEVIEYVEDIPLERVIKYMPTGNSKWSLLEIDSTDPSTPRLKLETVVDGKAEYRHEVMGVPITLQTSTAMSAYVFGGVKDIIYRLGIKPSKWF